MLDIINPLTFKLNSISGQKQPISMSNILMPITCIIGAVRPFASSYANTSSLVIFFTLVIAFIYSAKRSSTFVVLGRHFRIHALGSILRLSISVLIVRGVRICGGQHDWLSV
jgi:hypothetical protein